MVWNRQYELGFGWREFRDPLKNRFYLVSLQKANEDKFICLQQGRMSILKCASKFMELSHFAPTNEKLKMNRFEAGLNPRFKGKMSV